MRPVESRAPSTNGDEVAAGEIRTEIKSEPPRGVRRGSGGPPTITLKAKVFLGGTPLVKMATGEDADEEELGGAAMHTRISGLGDHFARDEHDCIRIGRELVADLNWRKLGPGPSRPADPPRHDADELLGIASIDLRVPFDPREVLARVVDGSRFDEYKPRYGTSLVTGWASIHGYPVGVLASSPSQKLDGNGTPHAPAERNG